jgi:hypothetical protein
LALIAGVLSLLAVLNLWHWSHYTNAAVDYVNSFCDAYAVNAGACADTSVNRLNTWIWLAMLVMLVQGVLYLLAFPGLRDRTKQGWNYVFYASLVSLGYAVVSLFTGYNAVSGFVFGLVFAVIGFWLLFQVRGAYGVAKVTPKHDDTRKAD